MLLCGPLCVFCGSFVVLCWSFAVLCGLLRSFAVFSYTGIAHYHRRSGRAIAAMMNKADYIG